MWIGYGIWPGTLYLYHRTLTVDLMRTGLWQDITVPTNVTVDTDVSCTWAKQDTSFHLLAYLSL